MRLPRYIGLATPLTLPCSNLKHPYNITVNAFAFTPLQLVSPDAQAIIDRKAAEVAALPAGGRLPDGVDTGGFAVHALAVDRAGSTVEPL